MVFIVYNVQIYDESPFYQMNNVYFFSVLCQMRSNIEELVPNIGRLHYAKFRATIDTLMISTVICEPEPRKHYTLVQ